MTALNSQAMRRAVLLLLPPTAALRRARRVAFFPLSTATPPPEWTEEVVYVDETDAVVYSGKGVRPVDPACDDHILIGGIKKPLAGTVAKIVEIADRWRWGPQLEYQLDRIPSAPTLAHARVAMAQIRDADAALAVLGWARRQPWYESPDSEMYTAVFDRLHHAHDYTRMQSLFNDMVEELESCDLSIKDSFFAHNSVIRHLSRAGMLELSFHCFRKIQESKLKVETDTYNALITLFMSKGLPYKAFEIYESMEASTCELDASSYELMIPNLAKTGRLEAAHKLFDQMKQRELRPSVGIFAALVDSMGKAGRLDGAMKAYMEMQGFGYRPTAAMFVSLIEAFVKAGKLEAGLRLWDDMRRAGFRPNFGLYTLIIESHAKSGKLEVAMSVFSEMEKAGLLPTPSTYCCLLEMHASSGQVDPAMKLYNSMTNSGLRPGLSTYTSLLTVLASKKLVDVAAKILLEMKASGYSVDVNASDILMIYIKDGSVDLALRWLRFMGASGIRTNNFIIRQLFESCMKGGLYESAKPLLDTYASSAAKIDLILYTSILAHLVRCHDEQKERHIMEILSATKHKAHSFMFGLFTGTEQKKTPVLSFVREFFQGIDYEQEEDTTKYFVNVLLNNFDGSDVQSQICVESCLREQLFPKAIIFDQHIAWSLGVQSFSVGAALIAVVHTLHRFRKRMLYYGVVPRRIKLVTGATLRLVVAQMLSAVESPFEVSKVVLRSPGDSVMAWCSSFF